MTNQVYFNRLKEDLEKMNIEDINAGNALSICFNLMQSAEQFRDISGPQRKAMVLETLNIFGEKIGTPKLILDLFPNFIDLAVSLSKGELPLEKIVQKLKCCC